jgi:hypothetical protein
MARWCKTWTKSGATGTEVLLLFVSKSPAYYEIARMLHRVPAFTN